MNINIEITPVEFYPYLEVGSGQTNDGKPIILQKKLPIYIGEFEHEQSEMDFLIICSDLQGMVEKDRGYELLGIELPEYLRLLLEIELSATNESKIGVLLCGDLFTNLDKRGASGDVRNVWLEFKEQFDWVVGVAGNHDRFGNEEELKVFKNINQIYFLHQETIELEYLKIGGISGIIGRNDKVNRVDEKEYLNGLKRLLNNQLDLILLHETPDFPEFGLIGNTKIRKVIEKESKSNIFCGHCYWEKTVVEFGSKTKVINVDSKVVILKRNKDKT